MQTAPDEHPELVENLKEIQAIIGPAIHQIKNLSRVEKSLRPRYTPDVTKGAACKFDIHFHDSAPLLVSCAAGYHYEDGATV